MSDKIVNIYQRDGEPVPVKYHDNGDGTFSPTESGSGGGGGDVVVTSMPVTHVIEDSGATATTTGGLNDPAIVTDANGSLSAKMRGLIKLLVDKITVKLDAGENYVGQAGSKSFSIGDETTRPNDTTIYSVGDVISATTSDTGTTPLRSLAVGRVAGGSGYLTKLRLSTDAKACTAAVRVHFYSVPTPATAVPGDNLPMILLYANKAQRLGHIDFTNLVTSVVSTNATMAVAQDIDSHIQYKCANGDSNIYYRYESLSSFTPVANQKFYLEVCGSQD